MTRAIPLLSALALLWAAPAVAQKSIVIDAGHGGKDPGGVGSNMLEKDIVLDITGRFRDLLIADTNDTAGGGNWTVHLTRDTDVFVSLAARADYANSIGADRFMCIHSNAFGDPSANGTETFSFSEGSTAAALRNLVQEEMIAAWGLRNRGNKTENFAVLRETAMPAVLHELGFITNAGDAEFLRSDSERQKAAEAHLRAIQRHFSITPYIPGSAPEVTEGTISGVVQGDAGVIVGAGVTLDGESVTATGEDGTFTIAGVTEGEHVVGASSLGFLPADQTVTVVAGETAQADFTLTPEDENQPLPDAGIVLPGSDAGMSPGPGPGPGAAGGGGLVGGCAAASGASPAPAALAFALMALAAAMATRRRRAGNRPTKRSGPA